MPTEHEVPFLDIRLKVRTGRYRVIGACCLLVESACERFNDCEVLLPKGRTDPLADAVA